MKVAYYTLGCKVNQYETEAMRSILLSNGFETAAATDTPDIVIVNSCTVTAESDRKTRQAVRRFKAKYPNAVIVLAGCMPQAAPDEARRLPQADIILGNNNIEGLLSSFNEFFEAKKQLLKVIPHTDNAPYSTPQTNGFCERTRAYIKIEDGCDRFCSYCIIPTARGRVRSRALSDIRKEAVSLAKQGFKEIILVGINLSAYGKGEDFDLCDAVDTVCSVEGILRVRLGSLEPDHITDEMLKRLKAQKKFCPQFHLSLQSGCDTTLKRMNRHYDSAFYYDLVSRIRAAFQSAAITTDIMVGFAGETDEEFCDSLDFVKKVGFASAHIFMYSRRSGTVAAALKNQVSAAVKHERSQVMIAACNSSQTAFLEQLIGKTVEVLFEKSESGICEGFAENYSRVTVRSHEDLSGKVLKVKITDVEQNCCIGELINN